MTRKEKSFRKFIGKISQCFRRNRNSCKIEEFQNICMQGWFMLQRYDVTNVKRLHSAIFKVYSH